MADSKKVTKPLNDGELAAFCAQTAMLLRSGISASEGLSVMAQDTADEEGRRILSEAHACCENGQPLSTALGETGAFPRYLLDMTAIGEQTGRLDEVMDALSDYYEREQRLHDSVRSAVRYPLVMIAMMVIVLLVLIIKVLPVFNDVFTQLGAEMSGVSLSILHAGQVLSNWSAVLVAIVAALAVYALWRTRTASGRAFGARHGSQKVMGSRRLADKLASARFASGMSLMLSSGLDTDKSLDMVSKLVDNSLAQQKISKCRELMAGGQNFGDALVGAGLFSGVFARMVTVGFKTGSADSVMKKLAERYQDEVNSETERIVSLLEPTLVAVFSVLVGFILLSVMLPLMGILSSIG